MESFAHTLERHGADLSAIRRFDADSSNLLAYTTLLSTRGVRDPVLSALTGVYEWQNTPLIFLIDSESVRADPDLNHIRRMLAMRGDAPYLGVVRTGQLTVYRIALDNDPIANARIHLNAAAAEQSSTFSYLTSCRPGIEQNPRKWISNVVLALLEEAIDELKTEFKVADEDAVSVVGRALFTRFLADRNLIPSSLMSEESNGAAGLFDTAKAAARTSAWLDGTFNGDFLEISAGLFESMANEAFVSLGNILRRAPGGQFYLEWEESWARLDFAHIPVGVLSEAYEHYLRAHAPGRQRKEGGYYTPRVIADTMVRGAFHGLRRAGISHTARVLDPAAGAGVFLITAFRELVSERWRNDDARPDTKTLREILYDQIVGFDINESALRFAALGLYLMSIELDPNPEPVEKLRFENLRGKVLHFVGHENSNSPSRCLGSLGRRIESLHMHRYDLVIGNPPWASGTQLPDWQEVRSTVTRIARKRVPDCPPPKLPNEVLDLPFVWRAMEWARSGAQLVFALHSRLLFQQGDGMPEARRSLFSTLHVTGIINGSEVRHTNVWPEISAPFCLLYARNELPPPGASFRFVTPRLDNPLNRGGQWRVDASNSSLIASDQVVNRPEVLKILFRGTDLDLELYDRLASKRFGTAGEFWNANVTFNSQRERFAGNGYQKLRKSSRVRKKGDKQPGVAAKYLWEFPMLTHEAMQTVLLNTASLPPFRLDRIHDPRPRGLFLGPLLLVRESPPAQIARIRVAVSDEDVVFNQTYYGYSGREHPDGSRLVRYLALVVGSKFALWFSLVSSGKFGFERETIEKFTIDSIPAPSFESLDRSDLEKVDSLFQNLVDHPGEEAWARVDTWVAALCGLRERDLQTVSDTLDSNLPFARNRRAAQYPATPAVVRRFCETLYAELTPWVESARTRVEVSPVTVPRTLPWSFVRIGRSMSSSAPIPNRDWADIVRVADRLAATEIVHPDEGSGCIWVGRLNQARYWSRSQAQLVARRIAWDHIAFLVGRG